MQPESPFSPTENFWQMVEKISDALSDTPDLALALVSGLDILLAGMDRQSAALYLPRFCEHITHDWTLQNIPPSWEKELEDPLSLLRAAIQETIATREAISGSPASGIGAIFPVFSSARVFGALVVWGDPIQPETYPYWQQALRPFARLVAFHSSLTGNITGIPGYLELLRSRNTLREMFDSLPILIYIIDSAYNIVAINASRADRVGMKPNQLVRRKCYAALYGRDNLCPGCRAGETFATGENTVRLRRDWLDDEKFLEWEINTFPIMDEKDRTIQTTLIEQDVTEKRDLETKLIQSEKLAAVGQLAAGIAHEINNPLTAIIANAQILHREIPPEYHDLLDSLNLIELAGTRASQVVRNLLGIARKEEYEFEPIDLNETIYNALSLVQHELVGRPIQLQLNLGVDLPPVIASHDQLQGVWINMMINAIDAIDKENGLISVISRYTGKEFQVVFTDNGKGIQEDHLSRVFEPFFTTKSPGRGTGLGLSVCMRVIRHYHGNIIVESQVGKWTRFTVTLPGKQ